MSLTASLQAAIAYTQTSTAGPAELAAKNPGSSPVLLADGTGANQADLVYSGTRTLSASGSEELDLAGGLEDAFGATLTFAKIKGILIKAASGNTNNVVVGGAASNAFQGPFGATNDTIAVKPGGQFLISAPNAAGWPVTAGTGDLLKIANSSGTTGVTYDIVIIGTSA